MGLYAFPGAPYLDIVLNSGGALVLAGAYLLDQLYYFFAEIEFSISFFTYIIYDCENIL
jgi:hypothetical protein